jgi:hypothetical protein
MNDQWAAVQRLLGRWQGTATGRPGMGTQVREYRPILGGAFILAENRTAWQAAAGEPEAAPHEDMSVLSFDRGEGRLVMRSFYIEGFVHDYRCVDASPDGSRFVFEAARIENGPPGMRARDTLVLADDGALEATFELAMPGEGFETYTVERLTRTEIA